MYENINERKSLIMILFLVMGLIGFGEGCVYSKSSIHQENEIVLIEGMEITAINQYGELKIYAGESLERSFTWARDTRSVKMWPREKRWNGSFGIYYPGPGNHWKVHDGITRAVVEESQLNFSSEKDILSFIAKYNDKGAYVYNDNGMFVFWKKNEGAGGTLRVDIWQFLINYQKPNNLPGSNNDKIIIKNLGKPEIRQKPGK